MFKFLHMDSGEFMKELGLLSFGYIFSILLLHLNVALC